MAYQISITKLVPRELSNIILHRLENNGHSTYYFPTYDKQAVCDQIGL